MQTSAEDKFIYTMPSAAELARSECLSVVEKRVSQRPQAKAITLRDEVGAPSEN